MESFYQNQQERLSAIANRKRPTRCVRGTDRWTEATKNGIHVIQEANMLFNQASTAGGWNILRHEIANFLAREEINYKNN